MSIIVKRLLIFSLVLGLLYGLAWAAIFYNNNLKGVWPVFTEPNEDITEVINTTGMPLSIPAGFNISVFAKGLVSPRVMLHDPVGNILVSIPSEGKVVALTPDKNGDGLSDETVTVVSDLNKPNGLAFRCRDKCELYIAEVNQVAIYDYDSKALKALNKKKIIDLPGGGNHTSRTIMFMPYPNEDKLLISVGSSCNVCHESDWRRAKILTANYDGTELKEFARGLRNSVFMTIHLVTGDIWATEMGRDLLGDDTPPDEINIIKEGKNYGWPICYGENTHDTDFDKNTYFRNPCMEPFEVPAKILLPAHSAPLGLAFIPEEGWPEEYWYNLLVAYHGSWNRSTPTGYKIVRYKLDETGKYLGEEDFISGWLKDGNALGRPADIMIQPGGVIYISDDKAGVIYKVTGNTSQQ